MSEVEKCWPLKYTFQLKLILFNISHLAPWTTCRFCKWLKLHTSVLYCFLLELTFRIKLLPFFLFFFLCVNSVVILMKDAHAVLNTIFFFNEWFVTLNEISCKNISKVWAPNKYNFVLSPSVWHYISPYVNVYIFG